MGTGSRVPSDNPMSKEPPVSVTPELSTEPVHLVDDGQVKEEERIPIFTMTRTRPDPKTHEPVTTETEFTIPKRQRPAIGLRFIYETKMLGEQVAVANLLTASLGEEAFLTLCTFDELTVEQFDRIQRMVLRYTMGDVETGKARSGTAS